MYKKVTVPSYAKVNLHLEVGTRRDDGYHPLSTVFQKIDLHDTITISYKAAHQFSCVVRGLEALGCLPGKDSLSLAARAWCRRVGLPLDIVLEVEKRIPSGAGLGGGSSNAAAVLSVLNSMHAGYALEQDALMALGAALGSDVPFFLTGYPAALGEGRGEILTPLVSGEGSVLVVMPKGFSVSTAGAYLNLDELRAVQAVQDDIFTFGKDDVGRLSDILKQSPGLWPFKNDFRHVCPHQEFYEELVLRGSHYPQVYGNLTGSGAAWVFVGRSTGEILNIKNEISTFFGARVGIMYANLL